MGSEMCIRDRTMALTESSAASDVYKRQSDDTRIVLTIVPTDMRAVPLDIKVYRVVCHGAKGTNDIGVHGPVHPRGPSQSVADPTLAGLIAFDTPAPDVPDGSSALTPAEADVVPVASARGDGLRRPVGVRGSRTRPTWPTTPRVGLGWSDGPGSLFTKPRFAAGTRA